MEYRVTRVPDGYLEHHGVKGQKWGVRRYKGYRDTAVSLDYDKKKAQIESSIAEKDYIRSARKVDRYKYKRDVASEKGKRAKASKYDNKAKLADRVRTGKEEELRGLHNTIRNNQKEYNKLVEKAAALPVYARDYSQARELAAPMITKVGKNLLSEYTNTSVKFKVTPNDLVTGNDAFDNAVRKRKYAVQ